MFPRGWIDPAAGRRITPEVLPSSPLVILGRTGHAPYRERRYVIDDHLVTYLGPLKGCGSRGTII